MKKILSVLTVALLLMSGAAYAADTNTPLTLTVPQAQKLLQEGKAVYSCPMHEHVLSDKPGTCPICGMDLVQVKEVKDEAPASSEAKPMSMPMDGMKMESK